MAPKDTSSECTGVLNEQDAETIDGGLVKDIAPLTVAKNRQYALVWRNIIAFTYVHIAAIYGLYLLFTSAKLYTILFAIALYAVSVLGITAGAHRLWAHRSYKAKLPLRVLLTVFNTIAFQDCAIHWARDHRVHHKFSETDADPHNAKRGFFFSHVGWLLCKKHPDVIEKGKSLDISDLLTDPVLVFQRKYYMLLMPLACFILPTLAPMYFWNESFLNSFFVATMFRWTFILNVTWLVNSAAHKWGDKPYDANINPVQNPTVAAFTMDGADNKSHLLHYLRQLKIVCMPVRCKCDIMTVFESGFSLKDSVSFKSANTKEPEDDRFIVKVYNTTCQWSQSALVLPGNKIDFSLETASNYARDQLANKYGFRCLIVGYENPTLSYVLGTNKYITRSTTSLLIKLKHPKSSLRFDSNFFDNNNINRILIECPAENRVQIEVTANAFVGNEGPFPEIDIVKCYAIVLRSNAFQGEFKLNITKSSNVMIFKNAFYGTKFHGHFERITNFSPDKEAFSNAEAKILILNCKIDTLHRLDGRLKEIKFTNSEIRDISSGAFDAIEITSIVFENCSIGSIHIKATTDRLFTSYLGITGCSIETIETKAIDGSGISEVLLRNNRIKWIKENAIHLTTVTAVITNNTIRHLNPNWFKVKGTNITITNNKFGDFNRITVDRTDNSPVQCLFGNNFISIANKGSLNFTDCRMKDVYINSVCKCSQFSDWLKELSSVDLRSVTYCQVDSTLLACLNSSLVNVLKFENDICNESTKTLDCAKKKVTTKIEGNFIHPNDINERKIDVILISIIGGCSLLFILILIGIFVLVKRIYRSRPITIPLSDMTMTHNHLGSMKQSKSFSNDDRDIINQTMGIIKEKQTPERYDQIYNNTKKLLGGNFTELDKVTTIGEIVRTLEECENTGSDFVAFTDILYKHLAPKDNNQNDPIYSEPNVLHNRRNDDEEENVFARDDNQMGLDHIYDEPNSVQQPLLTNDYALPIDRSDQTNVYTEPIPNFIDKPRHLISPYAIATSLETAPPQSLVYSQVNFPGNQPSTSKNLPDVLNPTNSSALHMKNQLTHLTRSPTTNRKIPKYTIPSAKFKKMKNNDKLSDQQNQSSEESNSHSDHSGGSDITYKLDEIIEYADA